MDIGFTGTQDGMTYRQQCAFGVEIETFSPERFRHGLCIGADEQAHWITRTFAPKAIIYGHPPTNTSKMARCPVDVMNDPAEYLARNRHIVDLSDMLIAGPKGPEETRSGTWSTVRYARKLGRPIKIIWPDGSVSAEDAT